MLRLSLPRKTVVRIADCPDMISAIYCQHEAQQIKQRHESLEVYVVGIH